MNTVLIGDVREKLLEIPDGSIQTCVTSPPYWGLRDYGVAGQIGLERTPEEYVAIMVDVFRDVRRTLKDDGTLWLNLGDSYASGKGTCYNPGGGNDSLGKNRKEAGAHPLDRGNKSTLAKSGLKPKDLVGIPWMVAFALRADGWYLRRDIIWHKPNPMPESVEDRPTTAHEYVFLLTKSARYYYDAEAVKEPAKTSTIERVRAGTWHNDEQRPDIGFPGQPNRNKAAINRDVREKVLSGEQLSVNARSVWTIGTQPYTGAHFAVFPPKLIEPCIRAGSKEGDTVLDPFAGSGTTLEVAERLGRNSIGIELNEEYVRGIIEPRMTKVNPLFAVAPITSTNGV